MSDFTQVKYLWAWQWNLLLVEYYAKLSTYWFSPVTNSPSDHCNMVLKYEPWTVIKSSLIMIRYFMETLEKTYSMSTSWKTNMVQKLLAWKTTKFIIFFASNQYRRTLNKTSTDKWYSLNVYSHGLSLQKTWTECLNTLNDLKQV